MRDPMLRPLEVVHLEGNDHDADLVEKQLREGALTARIARVQTEAEFREQIARPEVDVIIADCHCPGYDGFAAAALARERRPEVPFIFVSGTLDHHHAIESLTAGVTDFVFKQHLAQLLPVMRRAIGESHERGELLAAREHLRSQDELLDLARDCIILCDADGTIRYWNRGAERTYGWSKEEAVGQNVHALLRTQLANGAADPEKVLHEQSHWEGELEQVRRDGSRICVTSRWTLKGATPDSPQLQINTDISAQKDAEEALRESEERYRRFVDEDFTGNLIMRPDGTIETCNPAFVRIFAFATAGEALATNFFSLLRSRNDAAELLRLVRQQGTLERHELEMRQPAGEAVYVAARFVGIFDTRRELTQLRVYVFDDSKRKRLEWQLIQAQKMEGLGTLAGGIAHDFNNILTIILGHATQLEKWDSRPEFIPVAMKVIREAVERGAALVQQLLTSARQTEARLSPVDLNELVRELERMLHATFPRTINFELHLGQDFPTITADRSQIYQVLLNLCVNARDAMPHGGSLMVTTSIASGEEVAKFFAGADAKNYACIRVLDTGAGMTPEVKAHIFDPFFTTKERGKGTGLGLSVVYGVVRNHHGFVQVESEPGAGTTFSVYLPLGAAPELAAADTNGSAAQRMWEPQTILLVEDEEMLRDLGVRILEEEGYRVLAAGDGAEAIEIFTAHRDDIGLVVCDLGLPKIGGRDVFMKMKQSKPSVRAIVASGYLEPAVRSELLKAGVLDTMQKPYDFRELVAKIQGIIGKAQSEDDHPQLF